MPARALGPCVPTIAELSRRVHEFDFEAAARLMPAVREAAASNAPTMHRKPAA